MHKIHITDGIILEKRAVGEASTRVALLTRELGLVRATARSARLAASKLRYGLEPLTTGRFCLVRGKHEWRLTGVERVEHRASVPAACVASLLLRLIHGEEQSEALYRDVEGGFRLLASAEEPEAIETVLVLRILSYLGYLPHTEALAPFVEQEFSLELSAQALASRALLVRAINESLRATGL